MPKFKKKMNNLIISGTIKRHADGFGFFIPTDKTYPDIYIPRENMEGVMTNDQVEIKVHLQRGEKKPRGRVHKIIKRAVQRVTGEIHIINPERGIVADVSHSWGKDIVVLLEPRKEFKSGDWVSVEILTYPDSSKGFTGKVTGVIGDVSEAINDNKRVLFQHTIPLEFSIDALDQAQALPSEVTDKDKQNRKNLRDKNLITIDGETAQDFDDAVLVESHSKGFILYVAIADVSHYVKPDSPIDKEAYQRGNSTYLPNFVAPMLPEALSNELCSLKPKVDRLALVAEMHLDFQGKPLESNFYEAVICSQARVTYGQAQQCIDGQCPEGIKSVEQDIIAASQLAKILKDRRFKEGSLDLEIPESTVHVNEVGEPVDIVKADRLFAHKMIEEFMLIANVEVARYFTQQEVPAIYRVHEKPDSENVQNLQSYMQKFGFTKALTGGKLQKKMTQALKHFSGHPQEHILNVMTLRSMKQAKYDTLNIGHFGLGFKDYSHFTSPIRRYPDLLTHRQLKALALQGGGYVFSSEESLSQAATQSTGCEQRSVKAERQLVAIKKARFIRNHLGQEFVGMISSIVRFGVFVLLREFDIDGLIRVEELGGDYFEFDEENLQLVGKKSGFAYNLGDELKVIVSQANIDLGQINFMLAEGAKIAKHSQKKNKSSKKRRSTSKNSRSLRKSRVSKSRRKGKAR